ncbi:MAG: histidine kinase [Chitinophagaceae bacterium]
MLLWTPLFILYSYPLLYRIVPKYLLKERYIQFALIIMLWAIAGLYINALYRAFIFIPIQEFFGLDRINKEVLAAGSYLCMATTTAEALILTIFKYLYKKQQEWMQMEKEKVRAELQLLKAQVHPHFLFNTLNNIYSFSLKKSPKTPGLILKLSSLLSYMLYDCKAAEVSLEKELEIMKNYIDLEKERYGNEIEISLSIDGDVKDKYIAPLLLLPFLENAFKHGTSEQLENPWLSVDVNVNKYTLNCKILNSKNEFVKVSENGIGIENVKKRLEFLYPATHELNITDEKDFFVVSLSINLMNNNIAYTAPSVVYLPVAEKVLS